MWLFVDVSDVKPHTNFASISHIIVHHSLLSHAEILQAQTPKIDLYSFTQIMNVIPDAADWGGAAAWAYLPGQTSAFRSSYSFVMGVIVHEFGHNIGLHHSGFGTAAYADHSCLLGKIDTSARCIRSNLRSHFSTEY
jgi:hypothetical protein